VTRHGLKYCGVQIYITIPQSTDWTISAKAINYHDIPQVVHEPKEFSHRQLLCRVAWQGQIILVSDIIRRLHTAKKKKGHDHKLPNNST
jgi:hypothetical protein